LNPHDILIKAVGYGLLHREDLVDLQGAGVSRLSAREILSAFGLGDQERDLLTGSALSAGPLFEGRYLLLGDLGRGGMGVVSRAFDTTLNRVVALKRLLPEAAGSTAWDRFLREARALARLDHPSCVRVYDYGVSKEEETPFMALQLVLGRSLRDRLGDPSPAPWEEVARWGQQLSEGLAACHAVGLVHRDIKPANILLERSRPSRALLADFGIAFAAGEAERLTKTGGFLGTYLFCAPETLDTRNSEPNPRSDLYSLGLSLYVALTHVHPYDATSLPALLEALGRPIAPIQDYAPETPAWLASAIQRCLEYKPEKRFRDATELAYALAGGQSGAHAISSTPIPSAPAASGPSRQPWRVLGACALLGAGVAIGSVFPASRLVSGPTLSPTPAPRGAARSTSPTPAATPLLVRLQGSEWLNRKDGSVLVRIPAGDFIMGSDDGLENEKPRRRAHCESFLISRYEVTWAQFDAFCVATGRGLRRRKAVETRAGPLSVGPDHPVMGVSEEEALGYCRWAGGRLPSEEEWEYAARGASGRKFPWPDRAEVAKPANVADESAVRAGARIQGASPLDPTKGYDDGSPGTAPVGSYPDGVSAFGLLDMAGNVSEITGSVYGSGAPVLKGGGWLNSLWGARAAARHGGSGHSGFRLAMDVTADPDDP
tara:strand:+ start:392 stop:2368 length:1977 start_codon:yes stop_codon:yes gene_type:complete